MAQQEPPVMELKDIWPDFMPKGKCTEEMLPDFKPGDILLLSNDPSLPGGGEVLDDGWYEATNHIKKQLGVKRLWAESVKHYGNCVHIQIDDQIHFYYEMDGHWQKKRKEE